MAHCRTPAPTREPGRPRLLRLVAWAATCFGSGETPLPTVPNRTVTRTPSGTTHRTGNAWLRITLTLSMAVQPLLLLHLRRRQRRLGPRRRLHRLRATARPCMASAEVMGGRALRAVRRETADIAMTGTLSACLHEGAGSTRYDFDKKRARYLL